jgi:SAM-dependent methyltransferase
MATLREWIDAWRARRFHRRRRDSIDAYREDTNRRVERDPHQAVGGRWDEIGSLQFTFLKRQGLLPHHALLDIGCGTLRAGRHFIRYLEPGRYTGTDMSAKALEFAERLLAAEALREKRPALILNETGDLRFANLAGRFDFLLAHSVFTHLPESVLEEAFANVHKVMNRGATFFFTISEGERGRRPGHKNIRYPRSTLERIVESHGFELRSYADLYPHPKGQTMLAIRESWLED